MARNTRARPLLNACVALKLMQAGWKNVHPLYGGFDTWTQAGYPVEPK